MVCQMCYVSAVFANRLLHVVNRVDMYKVAIV